MLSSIIGCFQNSPKDSQSVKRAPESFGKIKSIEETSAGGEMGSFQSIFITKDSIISEMGNAYLEQDTSLKAVLKAEEWKDLLQKIDLKDFRALKDGPSLQPADGMDTQITIITSKDTLQKMNASPSKKWYKYVDAIEHLFQEKFNISQNGSTKH